MRIGVLLAVQSPADDRPEHFCSRSFARRVLSARINGKLIAVEVTAKLIWLKLQMTFQQLKQRFALTKLAVIPRLNPPALRESNLMLSYPPTDQRSNGRQLQREVWKRARF